MQAKAVVFTAPHTVEVRPVTCPAPGPRDVVVRVTHSWISNGTEGSFLRGERIAGDTPYTPGDPWPFPIVAGYQKIGIAEWVGAEVTDIAVGETVFAALGKVDEMFSPWAGQISPSVSPREQIWKIPAGVDPLACAGLVLTQVGYNCGVRSPIAVGEGAVVIGDGMVGHWAAQTLTWRGAQVLLVGRHPERLQKFGNGPFHWSINEREEDWVQVARERFPTGVQVAVDTVGSTPVVEQLMGLMKRYGHIVSAGFYGTQDKIALQPLRARELTLDLVSGWSQPRMDATLQLIAAGQLQTLPLITHRFPVAQAADAWRLISQKGEAVLGVILDWEAAVP
ncbi:MAG: zinc-binding dehydrogenase [Caldilineaceae bacterium]|nr:zinc-binding dehydrogenase [Caldilineaceae bacterium]